MLEREHNDYLKKRCKELGFLVEKFTSPARRNVPDWIITCHGGHIIFLEMKRTGQQPTKAQRRDHERRLALGASVFFANSIESIEDILRNAI